jgi:hypothetical protein
LRTAAFVTGQIQVVQSLDDKVHAILRRHATTHESQATAQAAINAIAISATQNGAMIRIKMSTAAKLATCDAKADVKLAVPAGATLSVLTDHRCIYAYKVKGDGDNLIGATITVTATEAKDMGDVYTRIDDGASPPATERNFERKNGTIAIEGETVSAGADARGAGVALPGRLAAGGPRLETGGDASHAKSPGSFDREFRITLPWPTAIEFVRPFPKGTAGEHQIRLKLRTVDGPIGIRKGSSR